MTNSVGKINVYGTVALKEIYKNKEDRMYFAVISAAFEVPTGEIKIFPKIDIDVPITISQYEFLKKELASSKAERPILRVNGDLELSVNSVCFN